MREIVKRSVTSWQEAFRKMVPKGFSNRETSPRSMRWPSDIAERVEKVAKETHQDFSTATFYLLQWALDTRDAQEAELVKQKKGKAS